MKKKKENYKGFPFGFYEDVQNSKETLVTDRLKGDTGYAFAVRSYPFVLDYDKIIRRQFIVLINPDKVVIGFTEFHKYVHSSRKRGARHISDDGNNRLSFVTSFLNYVFFNKAGVYHIKSVTKITKVVMEEFFYTYGSGKLDGVERTKGTVDRCATSIIDFMAEIIRNNPHRCVLKISDFTDEVEYITKRGLLKKKLVPAFNVLYSKEKKRIFRDIPNSVCNIFLSYAAEHFQDIFFLMVLGAFAGLRASEACNVSQYNLRRVTFNGQLTAVEIDLLAERPLRSDLVDVGGIKNKRIQKVYPKFLGAFDYCYKLHMIYLQQKKFEPQYAPMSINRNGMAFTYAAYYKRFQIMVEKIKQILKTSTDPEVCAYGFLLDDNKIAPHIFRHWFTVRLVLFGENEAGLQFWRGDRSPESAIGYLRDKGDLEKQLRAVSSGVFDQAVLEASMR